MAVYYRQAFLGGIMANKRESATPQSLIKQYSGLQALRNGLYGSRVSVPMGDEAQALTSLRV